MIRWRLGNDSLSTTIVWCTSYITTLLSREPVTTRRQVKDSYTWQSLIGSSVGTPWSVRCNQPTCGCFDCCCFWCYWYFCWCIQSLKERWWLIRPCLNWQCVVTPGSVHRNHCCRAHVTTIKVSLPVVTLLLLLLSIILRNTWQSLIGTMWGLHDLFVAINISTRRCCSFILYCSHNRRYCTERNVPLRIGDS